MGLLDTAGLVENRPAVAACVTAVDSHAPVETPGVSEPQPASSAHARPAVFVDRDGTLIAERHYLCDPDQVQLLPGAAQAVRRLNQAGVPVLMVTNQSGVARGYFSLEQVEQVNQRVLAMLAAEGARLDGIYVCPHQEGDGCNCRKPATGMVDAAAAAWNVAPDKSFVIGDKPCDIDLGRNLGAGALLVRTGHGAQWEGDDRCLPDAVFDSLPDAIAHVMQHLERNSQVFPA